MKLTEAEAAALELNRILAGEAMYKALMMLPCVCTRTYPYSGAGKVMCQRCRALVLWEQKDGQESATQKAFDAKQL